MAKLRPDYTESEELKEYVSDVLRVYNTRFYHINMDHISFFEEYNKKPKHIAKIRILEAPLNLLSSTRIVIEIAKQNWDPLTHNQKLLVAYHELCHIEYNYEVDDYEIKNHDVEDFKEILSTFGLGWQSYENEVPNILENTDIWEDNTN